MMLDKEQLEKDKEKLLKQYAQLQTQLVRTEGAIAYINDNLNNLDKSADKPKKKEK